MLIETPFEFEKPRSEIRRHSRGRRRSTAVPWLFGVNTVFTCRFKFRVQGFAVNYNVRVCVLLVLFDRGLCVLLPALDFFKMQVWHVP